MPPYVREIWDWLLKEANHKEIKYGGFIIKRGQMFRTYKDIREGLAWYVGWRKCMYHENHTKKAMKALREAQMIDTRKALGGVIITIINYDLYQNPANYERTTDKPTKEPTKVLGKNQTLPDNNKNEKNEKNKRKNNIYTPEFLKFWEVYPRKDEKLNAFKEWNKLNPDVQLQEEIIQAVEGRKDTRQWREGYIKYAIRFLRDRMWEDEIKPEPKVEILRINQKK